MPTATDYFVDWRRHRGTPGIGGVTTHAVLESASANAVCGVVTGGDGGLTLVEAGRVGCRRCDKILMAAGVLPLSAQAE